MDKIIKIMKKIKIRNILVLIVLFAFNAYAWFIYTTKVYMDLSAHVSSWDVEFVSDQGGITSEVTVSVERVFPGMETFERIIQVNNRGDMEASLSYDVRSAKIMDEYYEIGQVLQGSSEELNSEDIENIISNNYPFKISIEKDETDLAAENGTGYFKITVKWDYESGNDELDTEWGRKAYNFYNENPGEDSIEINLLLKATQASGEPEQSNGG
ncbi:MAG: hypothetical protein IKF17_04935 [Clostridia bacterium]|nr:hypothetical protein [Clostridia bacterium]